VREIHVTNIAWFAGGRRLGWAAGGELVGGCIMHDGEPTSSLPWGAAGCMTYRAEARKREMSKQAIRQETERLVKEALERKSITIKQGKTRIESKCAKCGALNRVSAGDVQVRVPYTCTKCGEKQRTF
jgi:hypothetical protein